MKKSMVIKPAPFLFQLALSLGGGLVVSALTAGREAYALLTKPPLSPPAVLFPIAWTILYTLMAVSATLILSNQKGRNSGYIKIYYVQLIVNFVWSFLFFNFGFLTLSFVWILLLIALVAIMIFSFNKVNKLSAYLQIPYIIWLLFAAYLNLGFAVLN